MRRAVSEDQSYKPHASANPTEEGESGGQLEPRGNSVSHDDEDEPAVSEQDQGNKARRHETSREGTSELLVYSHNALRGTYWLLCEGERLRQRRCVRLAAQAGGLPFKARNPRVRFPIYRYGCQRPWTRRAVSQLLARLQLWLRRRRRDGLATSVTSCRDVSEQNTRMMTSRQRRPESYHSGGASGYQAIASRASPRSRLTGWNRSHSWGSTWSSILGYPMGMPSPIHTNVVGSKSWTP